MDRNKPRADDTRVFTLERPPQRKADIVHIIGQVIQDLKAPDRIQVSLAADLEDPVLWVDDERIRTALMNISSNAVEAMPEDGTLTFSVTGDEHQVAIMIQDSGTGISKKNMDQLFTPFFTTKPVGEGLGLGLPTAYATVKAHKGTITVESNADPDAGPTGTMVRIVLPRGEPVRPETTRVIVHGDD